MNAKNIAYQIGLYLFELNNAADESGFNAKDSWELKLANEEEMKKIVKDFKPVVASQIPKGMQLEVFKTIKLKLKQNEDEEVAKLDDKSVTRLALNYIVAYNVNRPIR
jgi:hypothetical protein